MIRSLIREFLLQEEVFGAQAFVYHGSKTPPEIMLPIFLQDKFRPGVGVGDKYGKGLYAVYDLAGSKTESGSTYGDYIYKIKVNLYEFISFDPDVTRKIYKKDLTPSQQAELVGADEEIIEKLKEFDNQQVPEFSSDWADKASWYLRGKVKGIIYTGRNDGRCMLLYDVSVAVPIAWKMLYDSVWTKVDRESIKPALRRSSTGEWEKERYDTGPEALLRRVGKLPPNERIINRDLNLFNNKKITSLPSNLKIYGSLDLANSSISVIPAGLQVMGNLNLSYTPITSLPADLKVGKDLDLSHSKITSLPDGLQVRGDFSVADTPLTHLPSGLDVIRHLDCTNTPLTHLPDDLQVGGSLHLRGTEVNSIPLSIKVGYSIYGGTNLLDSINAYWAQRD